MNILGRLITWWSQQNPPDVDRTKHDSIDVSAAIEAYYQAHTEERTRLHRLDSTYYLPTTDGMHEIIDSDKTNWRPYSQTTYDCENYALTLMADVQRLCGINAVGLVRDLGSDHAYNIWLTTERGDITPHLYEPQTDELIEPGQDDTHQFNRVSILL